MYAAVKLTVECGGDELRNGARIYVVKVPLSEELPFPRALAEALTNARDYMLEGFARDLLGHKDGGSC